MKTTRMTTHWYADQLMTVIDLLDELRQALIETYRGEIEDYQKQRWLEHQQDTDSIDIPDEKIPF